MANRRKKATRKAPSRKRKTTPRGDGEKVDYGSYMRSQQWSNVKRRYWRSKLPKVCYVCEKDDGRKLDLHHRTYANFGNERLIDLVPVHRQCHEFIHRLHSSRKIKAQSLWTSTRKARDAYRNGEAD